MPRQPERAPEGYLTPRAAAELLGISPQTVRNRVKDGSLQGIEMTTESGEPRYYVARSEISGEPTQDGAPAQAPAIDYAERLERALSAAAEEREALRRAQEETLNVLQEIRTNTTPSNVPRPVLYAVYATPLLLLAIAVVLVLR